MKLDLSYIFSFSFKKETIFPQTCIAGVADALEGVDAVDALAIEAGIRLAVVDVNFTVATCETVRAEAVVGGLDVVAGAAVSALVVVALVDRFLAVRSLETVGTQTAIPVDQVSANGIVLTGTGEALVDV